MMTTTTKTITRSAWALGRACTKKSATSKMISTHCGVYNLGNEAENEQLMGREELPKV